MIEQFKKVGKLGNGTPVFKCIYCGLLTDDPTPCPASDDRPHACKYHDLYDEEAMCEECDGTGDCPACDGAGWCECCGIECRECDGSGKCYSCGGTGLA